MNEDLKKIIDRLHHDDPQVRKDAAVALGEMESQEAISALMEMLTDSNPAVRYFVKRSLGRIRKVHTPRHEEVTKSLKDGEKPDINVDALEKYLNDPEYTKRMTAVKGTLKIGSPLAVPFLIDRLGIEEH
ncbi:MAG: HEAT repeat domain-containing protein, partial [bacterium]|nr:HEAT repeat domain-containing protein [bacterium]